MGKLLFRLERKYGKYAIQNLSLILILCYVVGFVIRFISPNLMRWLTLNPYDILHGQVWRLVTWVINPPSEIFDGSYLVGALMLFFYYSVGKALERVWGDFRFNVYIFSGMLLTVVGAFIVYGIAYLENYEMISSGQFSAEMLFSSKSILSDTYVIPSYYFSAVSTYYICLSIFLAYAFTFPNSVILLFMIIPVRSVILGIIDGVYIAFDVIICLVGGQWWISIIITMSILNFVLFFLTTRNYSDMKAHSFSKTRREFRRDIQWAKTNIGREAVHEGHTVITRHKCAVCGRTELDGNLDFRFCSKCDGNYEYCSEHIANHEHVRRI